MPITIGDGACTLEGGVGRDGVELSARRGAPPLVAVLAGAGALRVMPDGGGAWQVKGPAATVRGHVGDRAEVHPRRWLSFGGVRFVGASERLFVGAARGGRAVVEAPSSRRVQLREAYRTAEVDCAALATTPDADGVLARALPPEAEAPGAVDVRLVKIGPKHEPPPVRADPGGPIVADFVQEHPDERVPLLETKGAFARVRAGHFVGFLPTSAIAPVPKKPKTRSAARAAALEQAAEFGMIGLLSTGGGERGAGAAAKAPKPSRRVRCDHDVRLVAEREADGAKTERFVLGEIAAGAPITIKEGDSDLAYFTVDPPGLEARGGARLATPRRDVVACAADDAGEPPAAERAPEPQPDAFERLSEAWDAAPADGVFGGLIGTSIGDAFGAGGLGLSGTGGSAWGDGIGLGTIGTIGHRGGTPGKATPKKTAKVVMGATTVNGRLPPEVIHRIVRQNAGRQRFCYEKGLAKDPDITGRVTVRFVIDRKGAVSIAQDFGSTMPDKSVVACVVDTFRALSYPEPEGGVVTVVYPITFSPQ